MRTWAICLVLLSLIILTVSAAIVGIRFAIHRNRVQRLHEITAHLMSRSDPGIHGLHDTTIVCISLESAGDRRAAMRRTVDLLGLRNFSFFTAITPETAPKHLGALSKIDCCTLSHLAAIREGLAISGDSAYFLVVEDDAELNCLKLWTQSIEDIVRAAPDDWGILKLWSLKKASHRYRPYTRYDGAVAYVVRREFAAMETVPEALASYAHDWVSDVVVYALAETTGYRVYDTPFALIVSNDHVHISSLHPSHQPEHIQAAHRALKALLALSA